MRWPKFQWIAGFEGGGVAKSDLDTCIIYLSESELRPLPESWQKFIMAHEEGHVILDTMDEFRADAYAFYKWVEYGYPLSECILAQSRILEIDGYGPHSERFERHVERVRMYDYHINNNKDLAPLLGKTK